MLHLATVPSYEQLRSDELNFRKLTGITHKDFEKLAPVFDQITQSYFSKFTLEGKPRYRQSSVRKNRIFRDSQELLIFGLIYLKGSILQEDLALNFGIDQPKVSRYVALVKRLLTEIMEQNPKTISKRQLAKLLQ